MGTYQTIDTIPDLTFAQRTSSTPLALQLISANAGSWDLSSNVFRDGSRGEIFKLNLSEGSVYTGRVYSYFKSNDWTVYDEDGNAIKSVFADNYVGYKVPYTGIYYVKVTWDPGSYYSSVDFFFYVDLKLPNFQGNDYVTGSQIYAGPGNDSVVGSAGQNYLRGEDGDDAISGGSSFDDINGNQGNDTASGGAGDDWVVGGRDNDALKGDLGDDIVYGNLGADTCEGGAGNDIVRGGQGDDQVSGGSGSDFVSGDKGADTISGGSGADIFHTFGDASIDRVTDFNFAEGDRVQLDPGTQYTIRQIGSDTVIDMVGGGQMTLLGVQMSTLSGAWIFGA